MPGWTAREWLQQRGGVLRGALDLATFRYPRFLFGGGVGSILPVFHFHEAAVEQIEPAFRYLAENGYRTVTSEAIARFVRDGVHPGPHTVALCFDDAWASMWTVVSPLLRRYDLSAIVFVIAGRVRDAEQTRPTLDEGGAAAHDVDRSATPFVTWPELRRLHASGRVDVQSHTYSHARIFRSPRVIGFVTPGGLTHPLDRPLVGPSRDLRVLSDGADLGAPLYEYSSRMGDCLRFMDDATVRDRCVRYVTERGGRGFFSQPDWERELRRLVPAMAGHYESPDDRTREIHDELDRSRSVLNAGLRTSTVRHICLPWEISGAITHDALRRTGYETAFADRPFASRAVRAGGDPYHLMRLNSRHLFCLPGRGRKVFFPFGSGPRQPAPSSACAPAS
jgi:hypothetical protein